MNEQPDKSDVSEPSAKPAEVREDARGRPVAERPIRRREELRNEQLPAVVTPQPRDGDDGDGSAPPLIGPLDDPTVPPDIEQRLITYWLLNGPIEYRADIVEQAPMINQAIPRVSPAWGGQRAIRQRL